MSRSFGILLASIVGVSLGIGIYLLLPLLMPTPDMTRIMEEYNRRRALEYSTKEIAAWFGTTGLDEETEREIPRYLRREFGEFIDDPKSLKTAGTRLGHSVALLASRRLTRR